jgi:hypothetical protein
LELGFDPNYINPKQEPSRTSTAFGNTFSLFDSLSSSTKSESLTPKSQKKLIMNDRNHTYHGDALSWSTQDQTTTSKPSTPKTTPVYQKINFDLNFRKQPYYAPFGTNYDDVNPHFYTLHKQEVKSKKKLPLEDV